MRTSLALTLVLLVAGCDCQIPRRRTSDIVCEKKGSHLGRGRGTGTCYERTRPDAGVPARENTAERPQPNVP